MKEILTDWVHYQALQRPNSIALTQVENGAALTWAELELRVAALAGVLRRDWNVKSGDRVALIAENDLRVLEAQFACMRIGAVFMPLNWRLAPAEIVAQLVDAEPKAILHDNVWSELADEVVGKHPIERRLGWDSSADVDSYEDALAAARHVVGGALDPDAITQLLYTSGTTGRPKGVMIANRTMVTHAHNLAHVSRVAEPNNHHLNIVPWFHAGGLNVFTNPILYWGGQVTTVRRFNPERTLDLLIDPDRRITHFCGVLQMYEILVRHEAFASAEFPALHTALFGGWGPATLEVYRAFRDRGVHIQLSYGATELGPNVTMLPRADDAAAELGSSGTVLPHTQIRLTSPEGLEVANDEVGELWVRGGGVTPGYWRRPREEALEGDWFRTGDAGRLDVRGHLFIVGRIKEMYRTGGENVFPAEVEGALVDLPGVAELAVVGVPDERWGESGLLAVVLEPGATLSLSDVHAYADGRLAKFKHPRHLLVLDELPRSATGKVSRPAVRERHLANGDIG